MLHDYFSLSCEAICIEKAIQIHVFRSLSAMARTGFLLRHLARSGPTWEASRGLLEMSNRSVGLQTFDAGGGTFNKRKSPNFRRGSEFSENFERIGFLLLPLRFNTSLIYRMFFVQCAVSRCWPTSCGVRHEVRSLTRCRFRQMEGNIDD